MSKSTKYALFCYDTENIGDEIQSIAASRFLPRIDYFVNRDNIDKTNFRQNEEVKIIMNGWYLHPSIQDHKKHFPPTNPSLNPLLTSIHISKLTKSDHFFSTPKSIEFLQKHSPVGARDTATLEFLQSINIPSYFSGCLSLTLLPAPNIKKSDYILAIDVSQEILEAIKKRTKRPVIDLSVYRSFSLTNDEKFILAKYWLYLYQSAHCIVTSRLHVILPSLALGTPVIALDYLDPDRFNGLINLANHYTDKEFIKNPKISVDYPRKNPTTFHSLRDKLIKICAEYTNYDSKTSYLGHDSIEDIYRNPLFIQAITTSFKNNYILEEELKQKRQKEVIDSQTINKLNSELGAALNPGIKDSGKLLVKSIRRKFN